MIPIFPLPNVVLFPNVFLPLHIFESRYRDMVRDALTGDRIIGMVLLREMQDTDVDSCSSVYSIGCAGLITHCEQLKDDTISSSVDFTSFVSSTRTDHVAIDKPRSKRLKNVIQRKDYERPGNGWISHLRDEYFPIHPPSFHLTWTMATSLTLSRNILSLNQLRNKLYSKGMESSNAVAL